MASFYMANPRNKSPERALSLQKYLLLHSQHEDIARRLSLTSSTSSTASSPSTSPFTSPSSSPNRPSRTHSASISHTRPRRASSATTTSTSPPPPAYTPSTDPAADESALCTVNNQIKTTLTTLLNCDSVRADPRFRTWVQSRLLEAERELKDHRRRRSASGWCAACAVDGEGEHGVSRDDGLVEMRKGFVVEVIRHGLEEGAVG